MTNLSGANLNNGTAVGPQGGGMDNPCTFPKYPAYKDSGVEWAGELPVEWQVLKLKRVARLQSGEFITAEAIEEDAQYPVYGGNGLRGYTVAYTHDGEFALIGRQGALCGNINYAEGKFWASEHAVVIYPEKGIVTRWLGELLRSMNLGQYSVSAAQPGLSVERIADLFIPLPSPIEQTQIARFLDYETARIDALIGEQQRLIELLKEKRQAVISHAVTKGLDPTVPLKDSGVEWLGEVPAHWGVIRSKFVFRLVSGYAFKSEFFQKNGDGEKVLITPGSFDELGRLYFSEKSTVQYEGEWQAQFELKVGDLVMVLTDLSYKKLILGRAAFVERDDALLNQRIAKVIITPRVKAKYLWLGINSEVMREQLKLTASGATVFHTSPEKVGDCWMALPPCEEQLEITAFVEEFHLKLDTLIQQVRDTVGLLGERRTALISAAVTGKIDVRGWQPPASAPISELVEEAV